MIKITAPVMCFALAAVVGFGVWQSGLRNSSFSINDAENACLDKNYYLPDDKETNIEVSEQDFTAINNSHFDGANETTNAEATAKPNNDIMSPYNTADTLKDYDTVDELLSDAYALVKVEVQQAIVKNVRSYIYTSYDMKILDVVYGTLSADGDIINVNMPGGTLQGDATQAMLSEVTEGKDAGDLSGIKQIASSGDTERLLSVGDEAYLFLTRESDTSFAVVGGYRGRMLLENGEVILDSNIIGFKDGIAAYGWEEGRMTEREFIEAMNELIKGL